MQDDKDRPSTETAATPETPTGENVKDLVTPGKNAAIEADAQTGEGHGEASPEDPEEAQSPT